MSIKKLRETTCDRCHRLFYRKLAKGKNESRLTPINDVTYWTDGQPWGKYKILCRACLTIWFEDYRVDFADLVGEKKTKRYYQYRYLGIFKAEKEEYKR